MKYHFFVPLILCITSCNNLSNTTPTGYSKGESNRNSNFYSALDTKEQLREKLMSNTKKDNLEFGELEIFDDYFYSTITKFYIKEKNVPSRLMTMVVHENRMRYIKMLMQSIKNVTPSDVEKQNEMMVRNQSKLMESDSTIRMAGRNFFRFTDNDENFISTIMFSKSKGSSSVNYWVFTSPEQDSSYLKFVTNELVKTNETVIAYVLGN